MVGSIHTDKELILTIRKKDFVNLKSFLSSINLEDDCTEILDDWFHKQGFYESAWNLTTKKGGRLIVIFGKKKVHVILKKGKHFESLEKKFFKYIKFIKLKES